MSTFLALGTFEGGAIFVVFSINFLAESSHFFCFTSSIEFYFFICERPDVTNGLCSGYFIKIILICISQTAHSGKSQLVLVCQSLL